MWIRSVGTKRKSADEIALELELAKARERASVASERATNAAIKRIKLESQVATSRYGYIGTIKPSIFGPAIMNNAVESDPWWTVPLAAKNFQYHSVRKGADGTFEVGNAITVPFTFPVGCAEDDVQNSFLQVFQPAISALREINPATTIVDTSTVQYLKVNSDPKNNLKPDITAFFVGGTKTATKVLWLMKLKRRTNGSFSRTHQGEILLYMVNTLECHQTDRQFMNGALYDGKYAQFFKVARSNEDVHCLQSYGFAVTFTSVLDLQDRKNADTFAAFLMQNSQQDTGLNIAPRDPRFCEILGVGGTSYVFGTNDGDDCVIKLAKTGIDLTRERNILKIVAAIPRVIHLHKYDANLGTQDCLYLTPPLTRITSLTFAHLKSLVEKNGPLRKLHDAGLVHRDVRPANIMQDAEGNVYLVDLGACAEKDTIVQYEGTLRYASDDILTLMIHQKTLLPKHTPTVADDLMSVVRCAITVERRLLVPPTRKAEDVKAYWDDTNTFSNHRTPTAIQAMLTACQGENHDALVRAFNAYVSPEGGETK